MKFNRIIFIALLAMLIFTVSAVSASDNTTDMLTQDISPEIAIDDAQEEALEVESSAEILENASDDSQIAEKINVTFDEQMWVQNLSNITVSFPENTTGQFWLKIDDEVIYNESVNSTSISVPIKLPKDRFPYAVINIWPPMDYRSYSVSAFYNGIELDMPHMLKAMTNPPDFDYLWIVRGEVLQYGDYWQTVIFPRSANGVAEIYVDGKLINRTRVQGPYVYYDGREVTGLALGNHTFSVFYENDTYYKSKNVTCDFEVVNVKITIPQDIRIGHDDCISVEVLENTSGSVKVYLDGVLVKTGKTDKGDYILSLADYVKRNTSEVMVVFSGKDASRTKTVRVNITYDIEFYSFTEFIYGQENEIEICLPDSFNNRLLSVYIDGVKWDFTHPENYGNNIVTLNISGLSQGNHTLFATFPGDDRFVGKNATFNFTVEYSFIEPFSIVFDENSLLYLILPDDAKGNLTVHIDGVLYRTVEMENGYGQINLNDLEPGDVVLNVSYTGDDYFVNSTLFTMTAEPKITLAYRLTVGQDKFITVEAPKTASGYVLFTVDKARLYNVTLKNGTARFSLKNLNIGEHDIIVTYVSGNFSTDTLKTVTVLKPKIKVLTASLFTNGIYAKVKVLDNGGKVLRNALATLQISGKSVRARTDSNGIATLKASLKLNAKKYSVYVSCDGAKAAKKMNARHVVQLKLTKVSASAGKLILSAVLRDTKAIKSKVVKFQFNGRKYSAKTNSKGVAKVVIPKGVLSKIKAGKKLTYKATYLKDTVSKTVKVSK